ncbi:DNA repair protein XRCC2 homolog isoform X2 [Carica papaya]|uniref:DNA repair protein XRCC2 homolog isoform X2 n=1 Tax=Carica papaya TaxID=3649 RepID=UPI000B8CBC30|nr:DNA repair protein XRCC2 homolog isoform X2 [Carica papaya]XP_021896552.1 DNA repair protein XRCC2 homolog isoform X2 [Carica papaya]
MDLQGWAATNEGWIATNESAKKMLSRVLKEHPFLFLPPLHRVPLRTGNVIELVGPSPSAKTQILYQVAINGILPKQWNGIHYGGLGQLVFFLDLDCRFDILRFSHMLKHRIMEANGSSNRASQGNREVDKWSSFEVQKKPNIAYDKELFAFCLRRFLYVRCYDTHEFLSSFKTLHCLLQKERNTHDSEVCLLMIDSIGSFHWMDRASSSLPLGANNRRNLSLQNVFESVVHEIRKLLQLHPLLVITTKATILGDRHSMHDVKLKFASLNVANSRNATNNSQQPWFREYMPFVWQSLVTHRIYIQATDDQFTVSEHQDLSVYLSEWLLPPLDSLDKFVVKDEGIFIVS